MASKPGVLAGPNVTQSLVGRYVQPRLSGSVLSMSPFMVLFSIITRAV